MRIIICLFAGVLLFSSCKSVDAYNASITEKKPVKDLQNDVDYAYSKLKKLHPHLYQYTPKDSLDQAFENLKASIVQPMTPEEFYKKLAPVVTRVGQGHLSTSRPYQRLEKSKRKSLKGKRFEFQALNYEFVEGKLYVKKVNNYDTLLIGSQVLKVNDEPVGKILGKYKKTIASDGYNTTFYNRFMAQHFGKLYIRDRGFQDSIQVTFQKKDSVYSKMFRYVKSDSVYYAPEKKPKDSITPTKLTKAEKKELKVKAKQKRKYNRIHDFNPSENNYARNFELIGKDSAVAYMKIRGFSAGKYKPFYEKSFDSIKANKIQNLIIDLRDNNGGSLREISILYSYLVQEPFTFINKAEVNSRIPTLKALISKGNPTALNVVGTVLSPIFGVRDVIKTRKEDGKLYYNFKESKTMEPAENNFSGKVYVLINGSSFSASSIISTNLQATGRATFVGEETGGAYNGTVAGSYKIVKLPTSKIKLRVGLLQIEAPYKQQPDGFGIKPDVEILPDLESLPETQDNALQWILNEIERQ